MTVISTILTRHCTVHASDSLITDFETGKPIECKRSKLIPVRAWRGALSYWGLAKGDGWETYYWLRERARLAGQAKSSEAFAQKLTADLTAAFRKMRFKEPRYSGLGIHLTAYEYVDGYWIPELFKVSNWADNSYSSVHSDGFKLSRVTYMTLRNQPSDADHGETQYRLDVHKSLQEGTMYRFNNGDPLLFNAAASGLLEMFYALSSRGILADPHKVETICALARRPIEVISKAQQDFCRKDTALVGGKPHDLAITPNGEYWSSTGDDIE